MSRPLKVCIIGAGSSYTPELISGFLKYKLGELPVELINLQATNIKRLEIMAENLIVSTI